MQEGDARLADIRERVAAFAAEAHARQVVLLEMSGHVLASSGAAWGDDVALGALLASLFGSARALAALFGEGEFRALFQQGTATSIYTILIGDRWLLVTAFAGGTQVGLVRMLATAAAADLAAPLAQLSQGDLSEVRAVVHSTAFRTSFDDTLDRLFGADADAMGEG